MYTKELGLRDIYNHYKDKVEKKNEKPVDYKLATDIIKDFNVLLREKILTNETIRLPYNLGYLGIVKFANKFDTEKQYKWKVDYIKSKEVGYIVYHGAEFGYRWRWYKNACKLKGSKYFHFKPCRVASRSIAKQLKEGNDYYFEQIDKLRKIYK